MEYSLPLPAKPNEVENFILSICRHYGYIDCVVVADGDNLVIRYDEHVSSPSVPSSIPSSKRPFTC